MDIKTLQILILIAGLSLVIVIVYRMMIDEKDFYKQRSDHYRQEYGEGWKQSNELTDQAKEGYADRQSK